MCNFPFLRIAVVLQARSVSIETITIELTVTSTYFMIKTMRTNSQSTITL